MHSLHGDISTKAHQSQYRFIVMLHFIIASYRQPRHSLFRECSAGFSQLSTQFLIPGPSLTDILCHYSGEYDLDPFRSVSIFVSILSAHLNSCWVTFCHSHSLPMSPEASSTDKKVQQPKFLLFHLFDLFNSRVLFNIAFPVLCLKLENAENFGLLLIAVLYAHRAERPVSILCNFLSLIKPEEHRALFSLAIIVVYSSDLNRIDSMDFLEGELFPMKPTKAMPVEIENFLNSNINSSGWSLWPEWILKLIVFFRTGWMRTDHLNEQVVYKSIASITGIYGYSALSSFSSLKYDQEFFNATPLDCISLTYFPSSVLISLIDNLASQEPWASILFGALLGLAVCLKRESSFALHQRLWNSILKLLPTETRYQMYDFASLVKINNLDTSVAVKRLLRRVSSDNIVSMKKEFLDTLHRSDIFSSVAIIMDQISAYENLGDPLVGILSNNEDTEYALSELYADVFSWTILSKNLLQRSSELRLKEDGLHVRPWLISLIFILSSLDLSLFTSKFLSFEKRMDLGPYFKYLTFIANSDDPGLLSDLYAFLPGLLSRIGGIPPILEELSHSQLSCLAGGKLLKFCSQQSPSDYFATKHSVSRIMQAITPNLLCKLWVSLGQLPVRLASVERGGHVKALSWLIDSLSRTFLQLTEAISTWVKSEDAVDLRANMFEILFPYVMKSDFTFGKDSVLSLFCSQTGLDVSRAMLILHTLSLEEKPHYETADGIFWKLSLSNVKFPEAEYEKLITALEEQPPSSSSSLQGKRDRVMVATLRSSILAEKTFRESLLFKFDGEHHGGRSREHHAYCIDGKSACLQSEFDILERAIIPRVLLSPSDAIFCACWIQRCHEA